MHDHHYRRLWNVRMSALLKENGLSYSKFIPALKKSGIALDRKILSELAGTKPEVFKKLIETVK